MDVVANLVGILIILIIVIGARAKEAMVEAALPTADPAAIRAPREALQATAMAANALEQDILQTTQRLARGQLEVEYRRRERDRTQLLIAAAEAELEKRRGALDQSQQTRFDLQRELLSLQQELGQLEQTRQFFEQAEPSPAVLEHLPTPMAKIVFGKELHFRLQHNRLVPLPWDELVEKLKQDAPRYAAKLRDQVKVTETLGPIGGFYMKYTLKRVEKTLTTRVGVAVQQRVELDRFVLIPAADHLGETIDEALQAESHFLLRLKEHDPRRTAVTIWVYPDSFDQFRQVKHHLYQLGFLTAARPLPEGHPIGGSPDGSRSAAQ